MTSRSGGRIGRFAAMTHDEPGRPTVTTTHQPPAVNPFAVMLRGAFVPTMVAGLVTVLIYWLAAGSTAGSSSLLGLAIALAFFTLGLLVMSRVGKATEPLMLLATAMTVFLGQTIFLLVVILSLRDASWLDGTAFGLTILVVALVWQVLQVVAFLRTRHPVYDEPVHDGGGQR